MYLNRFHMQIPDCSDEEGVIRDDFNLFMQDLLV